MMTRKRNEVAIYRVAIEGAEALQIILLGASFGALIGAGLFDDITRTVAYSALGTIGSSSYALPRARSRLRNYLSDDEGSHGDG